jgi:hypothetical protein
MGKVGIFSTGIDVTRSGGVNSSGRELTSRWLEQRKKYVRSRPVLGRKSPWGLYGKVKELLPAVHREYRGTVIKP